MTTAAATSVVVVGPAGQQQQQHHQQHHHNNHHHHHHHQQQQSQLHNHHHHPNQHNHQHHHHQQQQHQQQTADQQSHLMQIGSHSHNNNATHPHNHQQQHQLQATRTDSQLTGQPVTSGPTNTTASSQQSNSGQTSQQARTSRANTNLLQTPSNLKPDEPVVAPVPPARVAPTRKRGRRRQQSIPEQANGLDRVFVWDIDGSLVRGDTLIDSRATLEPSVLTSVSDKLAILAKRLKSIAITFCEQNLFLGELEASDQMHIDDVPSDEIKGAKLTAAASNVAQQQQQQQQQQTQSQPIGFSHQLEPQTVTNTLDSGRHCSVVQHANQTRSQPSSRLQSSTNGTSQHQQQQSESPASNIQQPTLLTDKVKYESITPDANNNPGISLNGSSDTSSGTYELPYLSLDSQSLTSGQMDCGSELTTHDLSQSVYYHSGGLSNGDPLASNQQSLLAYEPASHLTQLESNLGAPLEQYCPGNGFNLSGIPGSLARPSSGSLASSIQQSNSTTQAIFQQHAADTSSNQSEHELATSARYYQPNDPLEDHNGLGSIQHAGSYLLGHSEHEHHHQHQHHLNHNHHHHQQQQQHIHPHQFQVSYYQEPHGHHQLHTSHIHNHHQHHNHLSQHSGLMAHQLNNGHHHQQHHMHNHSNQQHQTSLSDGQQHLTYATLESQSQTPSDYGLYSTTTQSSLASSSGQLDQHHDLWSSSDDAHFLNHTHHHHHHHHHQQQQQQQQHMHHQIQTQSHIQPQLLPLGQPSSTSQLTSVGLHEMTTGLEMYQVQQQQQHSVYQPHHMHYQQPQHQNQQHNQMNHQHHHHHHHQQQQNSMLHQPLSSMAHSSPIPQLTNLTVAQTDLLSESNQLNEEQQLNNTNTNTITTSVNNNTTNGNGNTTTTTTTITNSDHNLQQEQTKNFQDTQVIQQAGHQPVATLRTVLNNHHKQITHRLSLRFHRIRSVYNLNRNVLQRVSSESAVSNSEQRPAIINGSSSPTDHRQRINQGQQNGIQHSAQQQQQQQSGTGQSLSSTTGSRDQSLINDDLLEILLEIDHYTLDWRKHAINCLRLISESSNCTNIIVTKMPLVVALGHLVCLGLSPYFEVDQIYSASKVSKEACIKRIKKRFGATNRCSYIVVGDREDVEMAKRLDLPSWNTSRSDGHRQLVQLYTALKEGYLM